MVSVDVQRQDLGHQGIDHLGHFADRLRRAPAKGRSKALEPTPRTKGIPPVPSKVTRADTQVDAARLGATTVFLAVFLQVDYVPR